MGSKSYFLAIRPQQAAIASRWLDLAFMQKLLSHQYVFDGWHHVVLYLDNYGLQYDHLGHLLLCKQAIAFDVQVSGAGDGRAYSIALETNLDIATKLP